MCWIGSLTSPGHITEALIHFNQASHRLKGEASAVEVSRSFFDALNKIQTEWVLHEEDQDMGEVKSFQTMILKGLDRETRIQFLQSGEMKNFVYFDPQIMNHGTLRRHHYRPDVEVETCLVKKATREHHKLFAAYSDFLSKKDEEIEQRVLKQAAQLLYIVRSNIAHGEKTPYGPDLKKRERDEQVCIAVIPLQLLLLNLLLDFPDKKLVTYGTLAPGEANHHILSDIQGTWETCAVNGYIDDVNELFVFRWDPSGPVVDMKVLVSPDLPRRWSHIDQFEGGLYKRQLVSICTKHGIAVANAYVAARISK